MPGWRTNVSDLDTPVDVTGAARAWWHVRRVSVESAARAGSVKCIVSGNVWEGETAPMLVVVYLVLCNMYEIILDRIGVAMLSP